MKNTEYYKSGKHTENIENARTKAAEKSRILKLKRIEKYNESPKLCKQCNSPIDYEKKQNLYCCQSCSAISTNSKRPPRSEESKKKTSVANTGKKFSNRKPTKNFTNIYLIKCKICSKEQYVSWNKKNRVTCGNMDCVIQASVGERSYQNGSRKPVKYFNRNENKEVLLESSWELEVANKLDEVDIQWIRPKFIKWVDSLGITRRYFPDFYLPKYDVYIDPKNPYCMEQDKEKMESIKQQVSIVYGDIRNIIEYIDRLCHLPLDSEGLAL